MTPYYADDMVTLYQGDMCELLPALDVQADCVVADPPYVSTQLPWDKWPPDWPSLVAYHAPSMWCFGTLRMFMDQRDQFADWNLSQEVVWKKHNGSGFQADRFRQVHELVTHWYRGRWKGVYHDPQREPYHGTNVKEVKRLTRAAPHLGETARRDSSVGRDRLVTSVLEVRSVHGHAIHPTEKPVGILDPLIRYACPPGGLVLDPFAGSGSTAVAARMSGRRAVLIEAAERYCEVTARRLTQNVLPVGGA